MNDISTDIQVGFCATGNRFSTMKIERMMIFMQMLCNDHGTPLAEDPGIDFKSLPKRVDFVGYSPIRRAVETAEVLCEKLGVIQMEEMQSLREVKFNEDIIHRREFKSLKQIRPAILERWYHNRNGAESFKDSIARVKEVETFLSKRQGQKIILVTHGWFLRLLEVYFVQSKHTDISLEDILETKPVPLGHCIKATVASKSRVESRIVTKSPMTTTA